MIRGAAAMLSQRLPVRGQRALAVILVLLARGDRSGARALFERALLVRPGDPRVLANLQALGAGPPSAPPGSVPR